MSEPSTPKYARLGVNVSAEVGNALRDLCARSELSITDGVRRAITVWKMVDDHLHSGGEVILRSGHRERVLTIDGMGA